MNKLVCYAGLYTISAGFLKLAGFVLFMWLARTLSVDNYANLGLLYSLQTGVTTFGLVGIVEAIVGLLKSLSSLEDRQKLFAAANSAFIFTLSISLVILSVSYETLNTGSNKTQLTLLYVMFSGGLLAFASLQTQIVRLEEKHLASLCFNFVLPFAGLVGSSLAFYYFRTVSSFYWGTAIGLSISLAVMLSCRVGFYDFTKNKKDIYPILKRTAPFVIVAFLGWLSGYGNNYIINFYFEPKEVAKFTFALSLSSIMQLIATALNQVWSPRFYQYVRELSFESLEEKNRQFFRLQGLAMGFIGGLVLALFPLFTKLGGGNLGSYQTMNLELLCLFSSYVFLSPWWHCSNYFLAHDHGSSIMKITLLTSVIGISIWLILMWQLGSIGIYIGFMTQMLIRSVGIALAAKRRWPVRICWDGVVGGILLTFSGYMFSRCW